MTHHTIHIWIHTHYFATTQTVLAASSHYLSHITYLRRH